MRYAGTTLRRDSQTELTMSAVAAMQPLTAPVPPPRPVPAAPPDEPLYEVVNGQRVELPPMSFYAVLIASRLQELLGPFVRTHGLGRVVTEALFILDAANNLRRRPDVAFLSV